jgi:hypothetical protein
MSAAASWTSFWQDAKAADILNVAQSLGARLKRQGPEMVGPCPCGVAKHDGLQIHAAKGLFLCRPSGARGDAIAMVEHLRGGDATEAAEFLTGQGRPGGPRQPNHEAKRPKPAPRPAPPPIEAISKPTDDGAKARWLWRQRLPITEGSPAWSYLRAARGFSGPVPATLGWLAAHDNYPPSLIAAFGLATEPEPGVLHIADGDVRGVHLTRLTSDGSGKAGGPSAKITVGTGSVGFPIVLAPPNDLLGLAVVEGVEDGLSVYQATGLGAWAAGSAGRLAALASAIPEWIDSVTIIAHADPAGVRGANALFAALQIRKIQTIVSFLEI